MYKTIDSNGENLTKTRNSPQHYELVLFYYLSYHIMVNNCKLINSHLMLITDHMTPDEYTHLE